MRKNYEPSLPEGYSEALHINAKNKKTGLIFNLAAFGVFVLVFAAFILFGGINFGDVVAQFDSDTILIYYLIFIGSMLLHVVLHELTHGIAYFILTRQKLTFGLSWSCAFCGVPNIYVYRKASMIATIMPFVVFNVVYTALIILFHSDAILNLILVYNLGMHIGGCAGDIYNFLLLTFKFKDKKTLVRDTGPEQTIYTKDSAV